MSWSAAFGRLEDTVFEDLADRVTGERTPLVEASDLRIGGVGFRAMQMVARFAIVLGAAQHVLSTSEDKYATARADRPGSASN